MTSFSDARDIARRIGNFASDEHYRRLTGEFFDADGGFAGSTFVDLPPCPPGEFCAADLVAASLLDVRFSPPAVRALLNGAAGREIAAGLPDDVELWHASDASLGSLDDCFDRLRELPSVGRVKATKLLARKRPALVPVLDRVIDEVLGLEPDRFRPSVRVLRDALREQMVRDQIENLRPPQVTVPTLRLLDAVTWMAGSRSRNAGDARQRVGLPGTPPEWAAQ